MSKYTEHDQRVDEYRERQFARKQRIHNFHLEMDTNGQCSFREFLKATLSVLPYATVTQDDNGQLVIETSLEYVEDDSGQLVVRPKSHKESPI